MAFVNISAFLETALWQYNLSILHADVTSLLDKKEFESDSQKTRRN